MIFKNREILTVKTIIKRIRSGINTRNRLIITLAFFNVFVYAYSSSQVPILINCLINRIKESNSMLFYFLIFMLFFLLSRITRELQMIIFGPLSQKLLKILSLEGFKNIVSDNNENISKKLGKLIQIITNGENSFVVLVERIYYLVLPLFLEVAISSVLLLINFGPKYSVLFFCVVFSYLFSVIKLTNLVRPLHRQAINETLLTKSKIHDYLKNHQIVSNYHVQEVVFRRLSRQLDRQIEKFFLFFKKRFFAGALQSIVLVVGVGIINYIALFDYRRGAIEIGFFAAINLFVLQFVKPFEEMGLALREIRFSLNNLYLYVRSTKALKYKNSQIEPFSKSISTIKVNDIDLELGNKKILEDVSLELGKGEKIAIVGKTGEGKSSLCRIMCGAIKPNNGCIIVNKQPLSNHQLLKEYKILYVSQETFLFNDDIEFNVFLDFFRTDNKNRNHLLLKYRDFFENNPLNLNAHSLSGGQKQFISFLRAVAHKPDIILFDEVNSSQDFKSYSRIINHILNLKNTGVIFVTHRLEMIDAFDKTYIIKNKKLNHISKSKLLDSIKVSL